MKNFTSFVFSCLLFSSAAMAQLPIAYYDFENAAHTSFLNQVKMEVNAGSSVFTNVGGTMSGDDGAGTTYGGPIVGFGMNVLLGVVSPATDPLITATHYQQFRISTLGFNSIGMEFDVFVNHNKSEDYGILYSIDNVTWIWLGSVTTPGSNSFPKVTAQWNKAKVSFPVVANNRANFYIRIYEYNSGQAGPNPYLVIDNIQVTALSTVAAAGVKNMLDEYVLYSNLRSGPVIATCLNRNSFTADGAGTTVNLNAFKISGIAGGAGGNLIVSNNAVLNLNTGTFNAVIDSAIGTVPVSVITLQSNGTVNLNDTLQCLGNIMLTSGTLNVNSQLLRIGGTVSRSTGFINALTGAVEYTGKMVAQAVSGSSFVSRSIKDLKNSNRFGINISSAALDTLYVLGALSFGAVSNSAINTGNNLTLASRANATAGVNDITNNGVNSGNSINGNVTVERYLISGRKWHFLSFPVNTTLTYRQTWQENNLPGFNAKPGYGMNIYSNGSWAANGFDYAAGLPTVKTHNTATGTYTGLPSTTAVMNTTVPYMVYIRGDRSITVASPGTTSTILRVTGTLRLNTQAAVTVTANKFVAINNPYAAAMDMRKITKTAGVQDFFYVWDPLLGGSYGLGAYQLFSKAGADYEVIPGGGSYGSMGSVSNFIKSGQAFFVRGTATGGTLTFTENAKANGADIISVSRVLQPSSVRIKLSAVSSKQDSEVILDGVKVNYHAAYSNDLDDDDALKMTNGSENLSVKRGDNLFTLECRKNFENSDTIYLNLTGLRIQQYQWEVKLSEMDMTGLKGYLIDNYLNTISELDIKGSTLVNFSVVNIAGSYAADRFRLVYKREKFIPVVSTISETARENNVVEKTTLPEVQENDIVIFPNPVQNKIMHIQFNGRIQGKCLMNLIDVNGRKQSLATIILIAGKNNFKVALSGNIAAGNYLVEIVSEKGMKESRSIQVL